MPNPATEQLSDPKAIRQILLPVFAEAGRVEAGPVDTALPGCAWGEVGGELHLRFSQEFYTCLKVRCCICVHWFGKGRQKEPLAFCKSPKSHKFRPTEPPGCRLASSMLSSSLLPMALDKV